MRDTDADEVLSHVRLQRRDEITQKQWQITAASFPHTSVDVQRRVLADLRWELRQAESHKSAFDMVAPDTRVAMIGGRLMHYGQEWAAAHPEQISFLRSQGVPEAEAIRRHQAWVKHELGQDFWTPARRAA